jgi:hypothetical protein
MGSDEELRELDALVAAGRITIDEYLRRRAAASATDTAPSVAPSPEAGSGPVPPAPAPPISAPIPPAWDQPPPIAPAPPATGARMEPPTAFAVAPPGASRQPVSPTGDFPSGPAAISPALGQPPAGFDAAQGPPHAARGAWIPPAQPSPAPSSREPAQRRRYLYIAAAALLAVVVAGAAIFLTTRGGKDTPVGDPTGSSTASSASPTPTAPADGPFGVVNDATNSPAFTGTMTLAKALAAGSMTQGEVDALKACAAADSGLVQKLSAPTWTGRGWVFPCANAQGANAASDSLEASFRADGFANVDLGTRAIYSTDKTVAGTSTMKAVFASTNSVVFFETKSSSEATALIQGQAMFIGAVATNPTTHPAP